MLRRSTAALALLALASVGVLSGVAAGAEEDSLYPSKGDPGINVRSYALQLTWNAGAKKLQGRSTIRLAALRDADGISLDLGRSMKVRSVRVDGVTKAWDHTGKDLVVKKTVVDGTAYTVVIRYAGRPRTAAAPTSRVDDTGLGWHTTKGGQVWTMQKPFGAYTWQPVNDVPSDKATFTVELDVPDQWVGVSNGKLASKDTRKGRTTTRFTNSAPMAPHLLTVAIGPYKRVTQSGPGGLPLSYWIPRGDDSPLAALQKTPSAIKWLKARLGPFPFDRLGVIVTPGRGSVESQGLVTLARDNYRYGQHDVRQQIVHNLVHQWYGASVTPADWRDNWMSEGMATYLEAKFTVSRGWRSWAYWTAEFTRNDQYLRDIYGPPGAYFANEFGQRNVHYGTAAMLERLKGRIGAEKFATIMAAWPRDNRHASRSRAGYISFVESRTRDLGDFWVNWLNRQDSPL